MRQFGFGSKVVWKGCCDAEERLTWKIEVNVIGAGLCFV